MGRMGRGGTSGCGDLRKSLLPNINLLADLGWCGRAVALKGGYGAFDTETFVNGLVEARLGRLKIGESQVGEANSLFGGFADQIANQVMSRSLRSSVADEVF